MNPKNIGGKRISLLLASLLVGTGVLSAADDATTTAVPASSTATASQPQSEEIAKLKAALAEQQKQLQALQQMLQKQQQLIEKAAETPAVVAPAAPLVAPQRPSLGNVASLTPVIPAPAPAPVPAAMPMPQKPGEPSIASVNPCEAPNDNAVPPYLRLGNVCVTPVGFLDVTGVWRDKNAGSGIGSNFGAIPYGNTVGGHNSEFRFSPQNSRIGFRIDADWKGTHLLAYNENDFLGTGAANNIGVTNGAFVPRLRLFWVDLRKSKWEVLAGQSWSLLVPNRKGLSALPGDLFYGQEMDVNYLIGLTWVRDTGARIIYHPNQKLAWGLSFENPNQYMGGSAGAGQITLPAALTGLAGSQLDNASTGFLSTPNVMPDIISKIEYEPNSRVHLEVAGLVREFRIYNPNVGQHFSATGVGGSFNANVEVVKNLRLISNNFWSDGGGRYLFGTVPDVVVRADGSLSPIHAGGFNEGFEANIGNTLPYAYWGAAYAGRNTALDANGKPIGYGYTGSPNGQNRTMQEVTFGVIQTFWKNPRYGALSLITQYEWAYRNPWYLTFGNPKSAHDNTIYVDLRYSLPGSAPNF
jgi:hypothetical protein